MKPIKIKQGRINSNLPYKTDHGSFKTKKEADRYEYLFQLEEKGIISDLKRNIIFLLIDPVYKKKTIKRVLKTKVKIEKKMVCVKGGVSLTADIVYRNKKGKLIVEMVKFPKDYKDPLYIIKNKLLYYLYRLNIVEN